MHSNYQAFKELRRRYFANEITAAELAEEVARIESRQTCLEFAPKQEGGEEE